ncbi:MAG: hypothetical protein E1N59_2655 [Puniceicoccaceae bacterium 5H]|nr:MAG: hypothetical protein E1N59_2655 [Puniceicoccaceae bacterium 5H]
MLDLFRKTVMAGIGATVVTAEKVEEMMNELVARGKLSSEEAQRAMNDMFSESKTEYEHSRAQTEALFGEMIKRMKLVTQYDLDKIERRLAALEGQAVHSAHNPTPPTGAPQEGAGASEEPKPEGAPKKPVADTDPKI